MPLHGVRKTRESIQRKKERTPYRGTEVSRGYVEHFERDLAVTAACRFASLYYRLEQIGDKADGLTDIHEDLVNLLIKFKRQSIIFINQCAEDRNAWGPDWYLRKVVANTAVNWQVHKNLGARFASALANWFSSSIDLGSQITKLYYVLGQRSLVRWLHLILDRADFHIAASDTYLLNAIGESFVPENFDFYV